MISVRIATSADADLVAAVTTLLPQLSRSAPPLTTEQLARIVADPATTVFVAEDDGGIVGSLTLAAFEIPTGRRAWIEDVVTSASARRKGVASAMVNAAISHAATIGARTVDLTSRPERGEANNLYLKLGFEQRSTNVYRKTLDAPKTLDRSGDPGRTRPLSAATRRPSAARHPMATIGASSARPPVEPLKTASP